MRYIIEIAPNIQPKMIAVEVLELEYLRELVGKYIEVVSLRNEPSPIGITGVVNEEGRLRRLPYNPLASKVASRMIVGIMVICYAKPPEMLGMKEEMAKFVMESILQSGQEPKELYMLHIQRINMLRQLYKVEKRIKQIKLDTARRAAARYDWNANNDQAYR